MFLLDNLTFLSLILAGAKQKMVNSFTLRGVMKVNLKEYLPTLTQTPNFLKILLYKPILRFVDFLCMSITVLLQKTRASSVPRFEFGRLFYDKKFGVQIANVQKILNFAKNNDFSKKSQGYSFEGRGLCF